MAKLLVALAAIDTKLNGRRTEIAPNSVFDSSKADLSDINSDYFRQPTEEEAALWTLQNASRERTIAASQASAPVSQMRQPATPNGPGGQTEQTDKPDGSSSVATDADSIGATDQGKSESTGSEGAPGGEADSSKTSSEKAPKASAKAKRKSDDLA